jgi:sulfate/thiosulfate transport system permease protein
MAGTISHLSKSGGSLNHSVKDPLWLKVILITIALLFISLLLLLPLVSIFTEAFRKGFGAYFESFSDPDALHAIYLTVIVTAISVPMNVVFGLAASWAIAKHEFRGKSFLITLIDLPFSVSPVIAGLIFILLFGSSGWFASFLETWGLQVVFAVPGIVLATIFVTFPFVARELIPAMQADGKEEEQAAYILGANGWQIFRYVTLPNVRWALLYGVLLCNARAIGEFGAVSVVSGHIRGMTNTIPLHIEILYNEYNFVAAFAMSSVLALLAMLTLAGKTFIEWQLQRSQEASANEREPDNIPLHQIQN